MSKWVNDRYFAVMAALERLVQSGVNEVPENYSAFLSDVMVKAGRDMNVSLNGEHALHEIYGISVYVLWYLARRDNLQTMLEVIESAVYSVKVIMQGKTPDTYEEFTRELCDSLLAEEFRAYAGEWQLYGIDAYVVWYMAR